MQIRKSGALRCSQAQGLQPPWISLTSDGQRWGHGLPDGRPVSVEEANSIAHYQDDGKLYSYDHTECRLTFDLEPDDQLISASDFHKPNELLGLAIAGWCPTWSRILTPLLVQTAFLMKHGVLENKAATWWYCRRDLLVEEATAIEVRIRGEEYRAML